MTAHTLYVCPGKAPECPGSEDNPRPCVYCDGGLSSCTACGGAEGAMPTECPGQRMTMDRLDEVYAGKLDFIDGQWQTPIAGRSDNAFAHGEQA